MSESWDCCTASFTVVHTASGTAPRNVLKNMSHFLVLWQSTWLNQLRGGRIWAHVVREESPAWWKTWTHSRLWEHVARVLTSWRTRKQKSPAGTRASWQSPSSIHTGPCVHKGLQPPKTEPISWGPEFKHMSPQRTLDIQIPRGRFYVVFLAQF